MMASMDFENGYLMVQHFNVYKLKFFKYFFIFLHLSIKPSKIGSSGFSTNKVIHMRGFVFFRLR